MKTVLAIQSHVVYGYAGNKSAVLPMQLLGVEVCPFNTVQFSTNTTYPHWAGGVTPVGQLSDIVGALNTIGYLDNCDAILSGYIGSATLGREILEAVRIIKAKNPNFIYFCDPVMGNLKAQTNGCKVADGIPEFFVNEAILYADYLCPNLLELKYLTGMTVTNFEQAIDAARSLLNATTKKVLVKHLSDAGKEADKLEMLLVTEQETLHISRPLYPFAKRPVGVGDLISALFLANIITGKSDIEALEHTANAANDVMYKTYMSNNPELQIVASIKEIMQPISNYKASRI